MVASWLVLLILFAVLILLLILASKAGGWVIGIVLGAGIFLLVISLFFYTAVGPIPAREVVVGELKAASTTKESTISNEELWDRLTRTKIVLNSEEETEADAAVEEKDPATEKEAEKKPPKPDWVVNPPQRMGDVYSRVVTSDPFSTVEECHEQLEEKLQEVVRERIQTLVSDGVGLSVLVPEPKSFGVGIDYIMREICQPDYVETVSFSLGEMKQVYVLMEFNPAIDNQLRTAWQKHERRHRLGLVGKFAVVGLSLLAGAYGLLQFDTWTRGYYTKRLLVGVPVVIIVAVVLLLG